VSFVPTFGGVAVFGAPCHVRHLPDEPVLQLDHYFGVPGSTALFGGQPGRLFEVVGTLQGATLPGLLAAEATLLSLGDGIARTLIDTQGRAWPNCLLFSYRPHPKGPRPTDWGWVLRYEATLKGLQ
jgi:hypothetical protein